MNLLKGWLGEKMTTLGMWWKLDENTYHRIDDVIIPSGNGTTQIDHILVSVFGIFVIETKNIKGWIFGAPDSDTWTQSVFGKKYKFRNPIKQNYCLIRCIQHSQGALGRFAFRNNIHTSRRVTLPTTSVVSSA